MNESNKYNESNKCEWTQQLYVINGIDKRNLMNVTNSICFVSRINHPPGTNAHTCEARTWSRSIKGVTTDLKVKGSNCCECSEQIFRTPLHFARTPPLFGGVISKCGGSWKVFLHSSVAYNGVVHYCGVWISHYWNTQGR